MASASPPHGGLALVSLSRASAAHTLSDLTALTAPFHSVDAADSAGYTLFIAPPLTAADGCISSASEGGMGCHYTRGNNLGDDSVSLLDPEFLVYAPKNGPRQDGEARRRLAWLWEHNPGGRFTNWNAAVPLCEGSTF